MEAPQKWCFPESFTPLEIPALATRSRAREQRIRRRWIILECYLAAEQYGNISNGVNIISYCALASAPCRPIRESRVFDWKIQSAGKNQVKNEKRIYLV